MVFRNKPPLHEIPPKLFISYSHEDKEFVDKLCNDLVKHNFLIWIDKWEIKVGESVINRISDGLIVSSNLIIILSPHSVVSKWVREEINAALMVQFEKQNVFVLPLLLANCEIPVFLKDKKYADFRSDYEQGFEEIIQSIRHPDFHTQGSSNNPKFHNDYSIEWGTIDTLHLFKLHITSHSILLPYSVNSEITFIANSFLSERLDNLYKKGLDWGPLSILLQCAKQYSSVIDTVIHIRGDEEAENTFVIPIDENLTFKFITKARRLGQKSDDDLLFEWKSTLDYISNKNLETVKNNIDNETIKIFKRWLKENQIDLDF